MMLAPVLLFATLLTLLVPDAALCAHFTCNWRPGPGSPSKFGFNYYLTAEIFRQSDTRAKWSEGDTEFANWQGLETGTVEINTPCGDNGWEWVRTGRCRSSKWAVCWVLAQHGSTEEISCYYFDGHDDCSWPGTYSYGQLPKSIEIWGNGKP